MKFAVRYLKNTFYPLNLPDSMKLEDGQMVIVRTEKGEEALKAFIVNSQIETLPAGSGLIVHEQNHILKAFAHKTIVTSPKMDYHQIAANLFSALHTMEDDPEITQIFIQPVEETGLGLALMDRINKAAHQYQK